MDLQQSKPAIDFPVEFLARIIHVGWAEVA